MNIKLKSRKTCEERKYTVIWMEIYRGSVGTKNANIAKLGFCDAELCFNLDEWWLEATESN